MIRALDVETTIKNKGHFASGNDVCLLGLGNMLWSIQYSDAPYGDTLKHIQQEIDKTTLMLFVNAKFDLHHCTNLGLKINCKIWDCQLVDFMLEAQTTAYPSMNSMAEKYGLPMKNDRIKEYWDAGIDTKQIPLDELTEYLHHDLDTTYAIYLKQKEQVEKKPLAFQRLVSLMNQDLLCLQEMEYNGFYFNEGACLSQATILQKQIDELRMELHDYHNIGEFNSESGDHLSCLLYGGDITISRRELVGTYKTGEKVGLDKYGWRDYNFTLPRLFTPLPKTELKKQGYWATGEDVLRQLKSRDKASKRVIEIILTLAKLEKIVGTYYNGLPKLRATMEWKPNILHGNLNQVTARTGRLSSTKPNLQNISGDMKVVFESRYK